MTKNFNYMSPETIVAIIVSLIILAVGVFAFLTVTSTTRESIPNTDITNQYTSEDFQDDTLLSSPTSDEYTYTQYNWGGYEPGINASGTDYFFNIENPYGCYTNFSRFNMTDYVNTFSFKFTQGTSNMETRINLTDENQVNYATMRINKSFINISLTTAYINKTDAGVADEITVYVSLNLSSTNATQSIRIRLYNTSGGTTPINDTGWETSATSGRPMKLVLTGSHVPNTYANLSIDDMSFYHYVYPSVPYPDIEGTGLSVFNIVGIALVIGAILTIVGLVYSFTRRE